MAMERGRGNHRRPRGETNELVRRLYLEGKTYEEIAEATKTSTNNVYHHVRRLAAAGELEMRNPA